MTRSGLLPVNFTLSSSAREAIDALRRDHDRQFAADPSAVAAIGWGYVLGSDPRSGNVTIGFYTRSELAEVSWGIQEVSGMEFVFVTAEEHHPLFEGRVLDHTDDQGFFLREP